MTFALCIAGDPTSLATLIRTRADHILGGAIVGLSSYPRPTLPWPAVQAVTAPLLGDARERIQELWQTDEDCRTGEFAGIAFRRNSELLYGVLRFDEQNFAGAMAQHPLQAATEEAYRRIFALLDRQSLPYLWRVWNYFADINRESDGLERYRQFNIGRHNAFEACGRAAVGQVPAACAIGLRDGPLSIAFIAGGQPPLAVENPRQISAYDYPTTYGPRSPTFSRAVLVELAQQRSLFISGTASIVGHRTIHVSDLAAQCHETLDNIAAVVDEANRRHPGPPFSLSELTYRAYLRHGNSYSIFRDVINKRLGVDTAIVCVQADICRHDLLVEIEAMATLPIRSR
ncbi:MAG TPA: hypothetical protein PKN13_11355 [Accumulibacter sp.]|nr:hypothetical protein [Accumulibacter sp.]HMW18102.1 hypothetical protein [Accumulibacter sp.]HMX22611.1 hypothetical protein [Accumulibacter sp.]HMY07035.1 hypothetical protein [Accumulibacter sp.]HNC17198.1 hypothetical protein [Accumulibacter sp.]